MGFAPGDLGRVIEDQLLDSGIGCDFLHVPGETRTNISVLDRETHRHTLLAAPGPTIEAHAFGLLQQRLRRRIRPGMWVVLAGSIPPPGAVAPYVDLIWMVQEQRGYVALDADGPVVADILAAGAFPTLLKLNQREIGRLVDVPVDGARAALAAARRVQARGVPNVIVTLGAAGAVACTEAGDFRVHAPAVQVCRPLLRRLRHHLKDGCLRTPCGQREKANWMQCAILQYSRVDCGSACTPPMKTAMRRRERERTSGGKRSV